MQTVSFGDNLHEMSNPIFKEKSDQEKNHINLSSAESVCTMVSVKPSFHMKSNENILADKSDFYFQCVQLDGSSVRKILFYWKKKKEIRKISSVCHLLNLPRAWQYSQPSLY